MFPANALITNNLAYAYLMDGDPQSARAMLETSHSPKSTVFVLDATWGLLHLWEGKIEKGIRLYKQAERAASIAGKRRLGRTIRQKMHLEVARAFLRQNETAKAATQIRLGLAIGDLKFERDLRALQESLRDAKDK